MTDCIYIRPVGFAPGPQHEEGKVIRLAGGMVYAQRFAVVLRQDGKFTGRWVCDTETIGEVLAGLPASVSDEAQAQLTNLTLKHPPLELGARTIRLDQPQVMGILNVTPDSFSDGGERLKEGGTKVHPTQKPEALLYRVLLATTEKGDVVLDPFFGTGTTGAVAKRLGREWIGCERENVYRDAAYKRIAKELPLDESAIETMQSKKSAPRVAFGALVENGYITPGTKVFDKKRKWIATVRADGSLAYEKQVGSIHGLGKELQGAPSCNGWSFWHYEVDGDVKPIDAARQLYLLAMED